MADEREFTLTVQNVAINIASTSDKTNDVSIKFQGNFGTGDFEVGYTDNDKSTGNFKPATDGSASADGDFVYTPGQNQTVFGRVTGTGATVIVKTSIFP